jgi:hypothetical protein
MFSQLNLTRNESESLLNAKRLVLQTILEYQKYSDSLQDPKSVAAHALKVFSQNGEDGIIREILGRLEIQFPKFVEIGASNGLENCTRFLLDNGATGLWIEGDPIKAEQAKTLNSERPVEVVSIMVNSRNILSVLEKSAIAGDGFDLLVVDTDGNDWWLTKTILTRYQPKVIVTEYNPAFGAKKKWIMPYDEHHQWMNDQTYGASLSSYTALLSKSGYQLVACDPSGTNAFWVLKTFRKSFSRKKKPKHHFSQAKIDRIHPVPNSPRLDLPLSLEELRKIEIVETEIIRKVDSNWLGLITAVKNNTKFEISSNGSSPVRIGLQNSRTQEPVRGCLYEAVAPGMIGWMLLVIDDLPKDSQIGVVQEGVRWSGLWFDLIV